MQKNLCNLFANLFEFNFNFFCEWIKEKLRNISQIQGIECDKMIKKFATEFYETQLEKNAILCVFYEYTECQSLCSLIQTMEQDKGLNSFLSKG